MHHKCFHYYRKCLDNLEEFDTEASRIFMSQGDIHLTWYRHAMERAAESFLQCWSAVRANAGMALVSVLGSVQSM
jgi:hypothetical protein